MEFLGAYDTKEQLLRLVQAVHDLRHYETVDNTKYGLLFQIKQKIESTKFKDLETIKIAAKNYITLALQRDKWDVDTKSGKEISDLLNQKDERGVLEYEKLKKCIFSEKKDSVTYHNLLDLTDAPVRTTNAKYKIFSSSNKNNMYQLYAKHLSRKDIAVDPVKISSRTKK